MINTSQVTCSIQSNEISITHNFVAMIVKVTGSNPIVNMLFEKTKNKRKVAISKNTQSNSCNLNFKMVRHRSKMNVTRNILLSYSIHGMRGSRKTSCDGLANKKQFYPDRTSSTINVAQTTALPNTK